MLFLYWLLTFVAALIWQLMRAYTLSILTQLANTGSPIVEKEIVTWVNQKLSGAHKTTSIKSFQVCSITLTSYLTWPCYCYNCILFSLDWFKSFLLLTGFSNQGWQGCFRSN